MQSGAEMVSAPLCVIQIAMLESHLDICRLLVNEVLGKQVIALCGARFSHEKTQCFVQRPD